MRRPKHSPKHSHKGLSVPEIDRGTLFLEIQANNISLRRAQQTKKGGKYNCSQMIYLYIILNSLKLNFRGEFFNFTSAA
jgi:hypothetical protein